VRSCTLARRKITNAGESTQSATTLTRFFEFCPLAFELRGGPFELSVPSLKVCVDVVSASCPPFGRFVMPLRRLLVARGCIAISLCTTGHGGPIPSRSESKRARETVNPSRTER
jgi:hypothetical protein